MTPFKKNIRSNTASKQALIESSSEEKKRVRENFGELVRTALETEFIAHINPPELKFNSSSFRLIILGISQSQMANIYIYVND